MVTKASQIISLNHEEELIEYHEIDEIYENEHAQVYDTTNGVPLGSVDYTDDEDMYYQIRQMILTYEGNEEDNSVSQR